MGIRQWFEERKEKKRFREVLEASYYRNLEILSILDPGSDKWERVSDLVKNQQQQLTTLECSKKDASGKIIAAAVPTAIGLGTLAAKGIMWHKEYRLERSEIDDAEIALLRSPHNHDRFRP